MRLKLQKPPTCPFCGRLIAKPEYLPLPYVEHEAGQCACGAVYALSITGFDRGATFLSALLLAVGGDWDLAWDLIPEENYQEVWIEGYDYEKHLLAPDPATEGRKIRSALVFIKPADDLRELREKNSPYRKVSDQGVRMDQAYRVRLTRKAIEQMILDRNLNTLLRYLVAEPRNLRELQKLLYHPEEPVRLLSCYCFGQSARHLNRQHPNKILDFIKSFLYASADTASSAWGALVACGEIIRETGDHYIAYVKNLFAFLAYPENITSGLLALRRISEKNPKAIRFGSYLRLLSLFQEKNPLWQALIIPIFTNIKGRELMPSKPYLLAGEVNLFDFELGDYRKEKLESLWENYEMLFTAKVDPMNCS